MKCPCSRECAERSAEPNCHGENCPHGYGKWKEEHDLEVARRKLQGGYSSSFSRHKNNSYFRECQKKRLGS